MIKTSTKVKKSKKTLEKVEYLTELKNSIEDTINQSKQRLTENVEEYKKIDFIYRHQSEEFESIQEIKIMIDRLNTQLDYVNTLLSDTIYANVSYFTDIHAYEVIKMKNTKYATIRRLKVDLLNPDEMVESIIEGEVNSTLQQWSYEVDEDGIEVDIEQRKNGAWYMVGTEKIVTLSTEPNEFYDFNA